MSASIRRLALDVAPWIQGYVLVLAIIVAMLNGFWLADPFGQMVPLMAGLIFSFGATASMQKIALWRTLPVSQRQIDLARWLQGVVWPLIAQASIMTVTSLAMAAWGSLHATAPQIVLVIAAQAGCSVILFGLQTALPLLKKRAGGFGVLLIMTVTVAMSIGPMEMRRYSTGLLVLPCLAVTGLGIAGILYLTAGRWPPPLLGWGALWSGRQTTSPVRRPGVTGWPALMLAQMPMVLLLWGLIPALPLVMHLFLGRDTDLGFMALMASLVCGLVPANVFALSMRGLRTLPLSGLSLTLRIMASLVGIQLVGSLLFTGTLTLLQPDNPLPLDYAFLPLALPMLLFALALRFGQRVAQIGTGLAISVLSMVIIFLRYLDFTLADTAATVAILGGLGFVLAYRQILSGRHAYRPQPLTPLSWRGR